MGRKDPNPEMITHTNPSTCQVRVGFVYGQDAGSHGPAFHKPWWPSKDQLRKLRRPALAQNFMALARPMLPQDMTSLPDAVFAAWHASLSTVLPAQMAAWMAIWDEAFSDPPGTTDDDPSTA